MTTAPLHRALGTRWIGRLGCVALLLASAALPAQERARDRSVEPLPSLAPLIEEVTPAVVTISVRGTIEARRGADDELLEGLERFFGEGFGERELDRAREFASAGSGVIVDTEQGYVLTNHHVIARGGEITVTLADNRRFIASVIGSDAESDIALLKIDAEDLTAVPLGSTDDLRIGDYVVAIGNPFGRLANTVTAGIVSGLGRQVVGGNDVFEDFIQTDAAINQGNSGGALIDLDGELVGINSAIFSVTGGNVGVGFSIPAEMVVSVMQQLIDSGEVRRGLLGIVLNSLTPNSAADLELDTTAGALVMRVEPESAADDAGLRLYDVILAVDGETVADGNELRNAIAMVPPGRTVTLELLRDGRRRTVDAVLGAREPAAADRRIESSAPSEPRSALDGIELAASAENGGRGLAVLRVEPRSPAAGRDLRAGDRIVAINRQPVASADEARRIANAARTVTLEIERASPSERDSESASVSRQLIILQ